MQPGSHCTIDSATLQFSEALAGFEKWKINKRNPSGICGSTMGAAQQTLNQLKKTDSW